MTYQAEFVEASKGWERAIRIIADQQKALAWCLAQFRAMKEAGVLPQDEALAREFHDTVEVPHKIATLYMDAMRRAGALKT